MEAEYKCRICKEVMKDALVTLCGHSFCYICIVTHLRIKTDCPITLSKLTNSSLTSPSTMYLLKKTSARQVSTGASPAEQFRHSLEQGCEVSVTELSTLLKVLGEKKSKLEQEEGERNMQILLDFLHCLRKQKAEKLNEMQSNLQFIKEDIYAVERHRIDLHKARDRFSMKIRRHTHDSTSSCQSSERKNPAGLDVARKKRVHAKLIDLEECYLQKIRQLADRPDKKEGEDGKMIGREGYSAGLSEFQSVLTTFSQYSRLKVIAELRHGDFIHAANVVSSIEFDRDDELFATAGVSRRIKVFDFSTVVKEHVDVHCPVAEMPARAKLSCLSWNKFSKNHIASSDYEGIVTVWDVSTRQSVMEYEEHDKRAWSVDFSHAEPSMLVSGSDDGKVKVWSMKQEASVLSINMKANICCVKYNPGYSHYIAAGSADNHVHYYDLRNTKQPLHMFSGHKKAVSYVKFMSNNELASASTDSTLRLWDVKENTNIRAFRGHVNDKNFVGLTANEEFIACGSETNEMFVYHKEISRPATWHRFGSHDADDDDARSIFITAVCWKSDSPTMLAANSRGTIKVLVLSP